jgi:triacylglycerol esterase/lipase EstA (alpha/beta hydrolase family)
MRLSQLVATTAAAAVAGAALLAPSAVSATSGAPLPVVYSVIPAVAAELSHPGANPPGANDWSCHPSPAHPEPVVLLHGLSADMTLNWGTLAPLLVNHGYCVYAVTYGQTPGAPFPINQIGGVQRMEDSVVTVSAFVDRVLASTGASKVDLLGHSEGTVMSAYYIKLRGGAGKVAKDLSLTPLYNGTNVTGLPAVLATLGLQYKLYAPLYNLSTLVCGACLEFGQGSPFLAALDANGGPTVPGVQYTNIATKYDELVQPYTSGFVPGPNVTNITVQQHCATDYAEHLALAFDEVAAGYVLNALDPAHPAPVPCALVLPGLGG